MKTTTQYLIGPIIVVLGVSLFSWARLAERSAWEKGFNQAVKQYESTIANQVEEGIQGYRRVQKIRERAEFERGLAMCQG